ncbi:alpha/beta hydrolase family protein [Roseibacillus ishigakijimensis]|uniref:Acetylxylan esterase n=1 Tax=Roseibacillus ishigakijimensis TaxID=454146 RepID=A0A934VH55_9BACT|nr:acetylxylan esterase [Roseibacillus ishigakijimensis]
MIVLLSYRSFLLSLFFLGLPLQVEGETYNYEEALVPSYQLPPLLTFADGRQVESARDWSTRRQEIRQLFAEQVYGKIPPAARDVAVTGEVSQELPDFLEGKATLQEITLALGKQEATLLLIIPNGVEGPVPTVLGMNFRGNHTVHSDPRITLSQAWVLAHRGGDPNQHFATEETRGAAAEAWPVEDFVEAGVALATLSCGEIDPDFDDGFENGVHAEFGKPAPDEWGSIATWAWGLSRAMDYLETVPALDAQRIGVFGFSRLGKTALWAGASDERFAFVISHQSGCGGAALSRRAYGETIQRINTSFPHWFADHFMQYNGEEEKLPVDQHQLLALIAPRPLMVASAVEDRWSDPRGEFLAAKEASAVYELLGKGGLDVEEQPAPDKTVGGTLRYHLRPGKHSVLPSDWEVYFRFLSETVSD